MRRPLSVIHPSRRAALALSAGSAAALALPGLVSAQDTPLPASPPQPDEPARLLENLLTRMGVKVDVGGRRNPLFVIDTGSERTAVSDRLAAELNLAPGPPVLVHGLAAAEMVGTVQLPRLDFSGRSFSRLAPPVFPHETLAADGLLGLDVLSRFRLTLDLSQRRVTLAPSGSDITGFSLSVGGIASRLPVNIIRARTGRFGQLFLADIRVEGVPTVAFIDSGGQYSVGNLALMRAVDAQAAPAARRLIPIYGVIGQSAMVSSGVVSSLRLAHRELGSAPLLFGDLHTFRLLGLSHQPALVLGADILSCFSSITLDYGRAQIAFGSLTRRRPPPPQPDPEVRSP